MQAKIEERELAIKLRKQGYTYREIRKLVPVTKSTLSLWFKFVGLSKPQIQRITRSRYEAAKRGQRVWRRKRREKTSLIVNEAVKEISTIQLSKDSLFLMGVVMYWAEGSKQKPHNVSQPVHFANTDPYMVNLFLRWLRESLNIDDSRIYANLYVHAQHKRRLEAIRNYWISITTLNEENFGKIYFKRHSIKTNRKRVDETYFGLINIRVRCSADLNRKIAGWIKGLSKKWGVV